VTAGAVASKRGYAFALASAASLRPPLAVDGAGNLLVRPAAAALNLTVLLPLSPTFVTTTLTPLVPWTQLLANIVGLSGVVGVVGVLFGCAEEHLGRKRGKGGALAGAAAGFRDVPAAIEALRRQLDAQNEEQLRKHAEQRALLDALSARLGGGQGAQAGGGAALTVSPLLAAARATASTTSQNPAPRKWRRLEDATDVWYVAEDGECGWEVPAGDFVEA
jgi:hypothetical protein